jgi:hypothetical protein
MKTTSFKLLFLSLLTLTLGTGLVSAQDRIAVIQSPNVLLLDPANGAVVDPSFIDLTPLNPGTPKGIIQVLDEIWITDQIRDRIDRFDHSGNFLSTISGGLDNVKGMAVVNGEVWVTNAGTNNGAPGDAVVRFDLDGNNLGFFSTGDSTFDIIDVGSGEVYLSYINGGSRIERRDYSGALLGNVVNNNVVNFVQQMEVVDNTSLYAAVFSVTGPNSSGLYEFDRNTGAILNYYGTQGSLRGVAILDDDNVLISNGAGVHILDPGTGIATTVAAGSSQFFGRLSLTPCTPPPTPTGDAMQSFPSGATLADIVVSPTSVTWFATETDAMNGTNPLPLSTPLVDGATYYAVNIVNNCLSNFLAVTVEIILSVEDNQLTTTRVYPNPTNGLVTISNSVNIEQVTVYTLLGQQVMQQKVNSNTATLDVSALSAAIYLINIDFGDRQQTVRLIKQD